MPRAALRLSHVGITLNDVSSQMEERLNSALTVMKSEVEAATGLSLARDDKLYLKNLVERLNNEYGPSLNGITLERAFSQHDNTYLQPDGGFWYVADWSGPRRYILISEAKRQGTRCARETEGLPRQSRGNAIERLGKNLRGFDAMYLGEGITPVVVFGEGCDFEPESTILDRVATMNGFFPLNTVYTRKFKLRGGDAVSPVTMFFQHDPWPISEMATVLIEVALASIEYFRTTYSLP